jgi:hypothetical protein
MPRLVSPILAAAAVAVLTSAVLATAASARSVPGAAERGTTTRTSLTKAQQDTTCYAQLDGDNGIGIVSQVFESDFSIYDSRAADDFQIARQCTVNTVMVNGMYFNGSGPADSVKVVFYHSRDASRVGRVILRENNLSYSDPSGAGNFTIDLSKPFVPTHRTNWVSVKADMDFSTGGEWGWLTNNTARRLNSRWANPDDGFATGCTTWGDTVDCIPAGEGPDFSFALLN